MINPDGEVSNMCDDVSTVGSSNDVYLASPFYFSESNTTTPSNHSCHCLLTTGGTLTVQVLYANFTAKDFDFVCEACWGNNSQTEHLPLSLINKALDVEEAQMYVVNISLNHKESDTAGLKVWIKFTSKFVFCSLVLKYLYCVCVLKCPADSRKKVRLIRQLHVTALKRYLFSYSLEISSAVRCAISRHSSRRNFGVLLIRKTFFKHFTSINSFRKFW